MQELKKRELLASFNRVKKKACNMRRGLGIPGGAHLPLRHSPGHERPQHVEIAQTMHLV
jgi:hypothetical protein